MDAAVVCRTDISPGFDGELAARRIDKLALARWRVTLARLVGERRAPVIAATIEHAFPQRPSTATPGPCRRSVVGQVLRDGKL